MSDVKTIKNRSTEAISEIPAAQWKKMQDSGKAEYYELVEAPAISKEVSAKLADKNMAGPKTPASDNDNRTTTDRLPGNNPGKIG